MLHNWYKLMCLKMKKAAFLCAREAEKVGEVLANSRSVSGRTKVTDKDITKVMMSRLRGH